MKTETTKVSLNGSLLKTVVRQRSWPDCQQCGALVVSGKTSCGSCQAAVRKRVVFTRPAVWRRMFADVLDRLVPLPFLAFFFPGWTLVVVAYHLLCESGPERRGLGKWVGRLRVVDAAGASHCEWWQGMLRRLGMAASQVAWCLWLGVPWVLAYELAALASVLLNAQGRRPEDFLAGTRVVTEKTFRQMQKMEKQVQENRNA
ncbi:MAG: hypothetical protein U0Z53_31250 [Blastocatellia bacterium]